MVRWSPQYRSCIARGFQNFGNAEVCQLNLLHVAIYQQVRRLHVSVQDSLAVDVMQSTANHVENALLKLAAEWWLFVQPPCFDVIPKITTIHKLQSQPRTLPGGIKLYIVAANNVRMAKPL
mmetsp:Transcript_28938/g.46755  ORF Transcript_28938/g.46755 Transcript_28938/m.46755 type:complete len:121 (+) Transcript_28938:743-1105(+)